jgi:hypothetical protein
VPEEPDVRYDVIYFFPNGSTGIEVGSGATMGVLADMASWGKVTLSLADATPTLTFGGDTAIHTDGNALVWVRYVIVIPVMTKFSQYDTNLPYALPPVMVFDIKKIPASCPVMIATIQAYGVIRRRHLHYIEALQRAKKGSPPVLPRAAQLSRSTLFSDPYYHGMAGFLLAFLLPHLALVPYAKKVELLQLISRVSNDSFAVSGEMALESMTEAWEAAQGGEDVSYVLAVFMSFYFIVRTVRTFKLTSVVWLPEDGPEYNKSDLDTATSTLEVTIKHYLREDRVKRGFTDGLTSYVYILR